MLYQGVKHPLLIIWQLFPTYTTSISTWLAIDVIHQPSGNDSVTSRCFWCPDLFAIAMVSLSCLQFLIFAR